MLWQTVPGWQAYWASVAELDHERLANFLPHLAFHATMLHGAVPGQVVNQAAKVFLPAAWSISLEWQFYLVAPLVIAAALHRRGLAALALAALALHVAYNRGLLGHYDVGSSIAGTTGYFAVGVASRLACDALAKVRIHPLPVAAALLYAAAALATDALPFAIWGSSSAICCGTSTTGGAGPCSAC